MFRRAKEKGEKRSAVRDVKTMEATIHMHKRLHGNVYVGCSRTLNTNGIICHVTTQTHSCLSLSSRCVCLLDRGFKKRAPRAIKEIKKFASKVCTFMHLPTLILCVGVDDSVTWRHCMRNCERVHGNTDLSRTARS